MKKEAKKSKKQEAKKPEKKNFGGRLSAWLKGGIIGAIIGVLLALPLILLTFGVNIPGFIVGISDIVYLPAVWCFTKIIFLPLLSIGVKFSISGLFYSIAVFGVVFYFIVGIIVGWLAKKIIEKRKYIVSKK